ncbi:MAG TPA: von Willebrand factor type A domain-containing protein, partial [Acidobacteriota bacterium]|nr:von Willebrand factor type A domain-containing protein [Acidobacteriota bacterium]
MPKSNRTLLMVLFLTGLLFAQGCHIGRSPSSQESKDKARPTSPVTSAPAQRPSGTGVPASPPAFAAKEASSSMPADADQSNTEDYRDYGVNQMTSAKQDPLSTFAIDVDTASYPIPRRKLNEGQLPPPAAVRVEEFINYFNYNYPQPATAHPFSVTLEAAPSPFQANRHLMRVGIHGKEIPVTNRPPAHLTFLVDTSGSMQAADKIGLLKQSLKLL